ncbi:hypothetical protein BGZ81_007233 [Podila clonocystis]|nr:hypothetical protein BGZ81_007233 [Podila clonocystis]
MSTFNHSDYFVTGPNHVLCEIPGVDQPSFPKTFQDSWDMDHVRLACSDRIYRTDVSQWPEIVQALSQPIRSSQELSEVILRWNKAKEVGWNFNALDAFLNHRTDAELVAQAERIIDVTTPATESFDPMTEAMASIVIPKYTVSASEDEDEDEQLQSQAPVALPHVPLTSQFLSPAERTRFFDVILPRMQALALRLPELIKKPIPFLKQQQDSAITLSQEQIACLNANAFFNTFPGRNVPYKTKSYRRKWRPSRKNTQPRKEQQERDQRAGVVSQPDVEEPQEEVHDDSEEEEEEEGGSKRSKGAASRGGRGRGNGRGGRGGNTSSATVRTPKPFKRTPGPAGQFDFVEESMSASIETVSSEPSVKTQSTDKESNVEELMVKDTEVSTTSAPTGEADPRGPKMPSINLVSMFWSEQTGKNACTDAQAAKLRCLIHYFDRITSEMPTGTVTYHRQVLRKPVYLTSKEGVISQDTFKLSSVVVDAVNGLETAQQGALQLDFANKNIGGGALDRGAVQEEIRFMICPEMIVSRLFSQPMEANEAILIKGIEQYSDYIGYSKSFEWFADHRDTTPRDKLGRRQREICAIDAKPFKSKVSRIGQFDKPLVLREINKAIAGFRPSPINASEWGLVPHLEGGNESAGTVPTVPRAIATGNWGCGAFGGHLQLKFVLQWIAASVSSKLSAGMDATLTHDMLYYTFGIPELARDIEAFVKVLESKPSIDPLRLVECLVKYPRRSSTGVAEKLREKSLLEYLSSAMDY